MNWKRVLLSIGQVSALLVPYALEWGGRWLEGRKNESNESEQEEHLAQVLSEQQEQLVMEIEQVRQLVNERCPCDEDAVRYLTLAEAFLPCGLNSSAGQEAVGDTLNVSLSAKEIFKVRLTDLPVAFRYVEMSREIAEAAGSDDSESVE